MSNPPPPTAPRRWPRISLRQALAVVFIVAVAMAAFGANDAIWSAALTNVNVALLVAAAVSAIYASTRPRAFCIGFLIGDGLITLAEFLPDIGHSLIQHMLAFQLWNPDAPRALHSATLERAYMGAMLTGWLYGCAAGALAVWLRTVAANRNHRPTIDQT